MSFIGLDQSQKTEGFCVADFVTLSDDRRSGSKIFPLFIWIKRPCSRKFEGLEHSKLLGISQTRIIPHEPESMLLSKWCPVIHNLEFHRDHVQDHFCS